MKWETVKLGDIATCIQPGPFGSQLHNSDYSETGTPIIMPKDMINGHISHTNLIHVGDVHISRLSRHQVHKGNIMVARKGDVRKCVFITEKEDGWMTGSDCLKVALNEEVCFPKFIYYQLRSPFIGKWLETISIGATMSSLNTGLLSGIEVFLPPITVQKTILDILSAYDDLIENNQKQIKLLEEVAQRLYKEWFIDFRFPGHESTPIRNGIPEGWERKAFSEVFSYVRGRSYSSKELSDEGILMANLKNIRAFGGYNRGAEKRYIGEYKDSQLLSAGDIIMGVTDMTQERRLVGHVAVVPAVKEPMVFSMDLIKLLPTTCPKSFLYSAMQFGGLSDRISPLANGVNVLHLKPEAMMNLKMVISDETTMLKYDEVFSAIQRKIELLQDQSAVAEEARDRLLPKLMSGEIEV